MKMQRPDCDPPGDYSKAAAAAMVLAVATAHLTDRDIEAIATDMGLLRSDVLQVVRSVGALKSELAQRAGHVRIKLPEKAW